MVSRSLLCGDGFAGTWLADKPPTPKISRFADTDKPLRHQSAGCKQP